MNTIDYLKHKYNGTSTQIKNHYAIIVQLASKQQVMLCANTTSTGLFQARLCTKVLIMQCYLESQ
jgi:hypothetical protein